MDPRKEKALELFHSGNNCAQSVFTAFVDELGLSEQEARRFMEAFGGGIGASHEEVCGALSATCAAIGYFNSDGSQTATTKAHTYKTIQEVLDKFEKELGSRRCGPILKENAKEGTNCDHVVLKGVELIEEYLNEK